MLVSVLPLTTARALELDAMHRIGDRLPPRLRALARWSAADANGCGWGKELATADFTRSGLGGELAAETAAERATALFARRMMTEAYAVTDAEVAELLGLIGEEQLVALVTLVAHASYQDRLVLALGAREEADISPPITTRFARPKPTAPAPGAASTATQSAEEPANAQWQQHRESLAKQKARPGRIRIPPREEMLVRLGEGNPLAWQVGLAWSRVCYTFQPELTDAWFGCTGAFRQEANLDAVFQNSLFWVVTEALQCFY